jgi:hypothetical protein
MRWSDSITPDGTAPSPKKRAPNFSAAMPSPMHSRLTDSATVTDLLTVTRSGRPRAKLRIPSTNPKPPKFYEEAARAYLELAAEGNRPAKELAEANDVPVSTAHRWVKEARRRGFLPPGQKGRRG